MSLLHVIQLCCRVMLCLDEHLIISVFFFFLFVNLLAFKCLVWKSDEHCEMGGGTFESHAISRKKPVLTTCMEKVDLDCHASYCWEARKYFKDVSKQDFDFGKEYITLCGILIRVFESSVFLLQKIIHAG